MDMSYEPIAAVKQRMWGPELKWDWKDLRHIYMVKPAALGN